MKKRGFTLVELLAVIAILAILVIIALPNVLEMFNDAKKNTFVTEVKTIFKQSKTDFINDSLEQAGARYYCSGGTGNGLSMTGCKALNLTTSKEYAIKTYNSGEVEFIAVKDGSYVYGLRAEGDAFIDINDISSVGVESTSSEKGKLVRDLWYFRTAVVTLEPSDDKGQPVIGEDFVITKDPIIEFADEDTH